MAFRSDMNRLAMEAYRPYVLELSGDPAKLCSVIGALDPPPLADTLRWMYQA
ncbi:MAG: hypothetical protein ABIT83_13450 [Massilia sp.]